MADEVFDILRNRYVACTPEEVVRQNFIHCLIDTKGYPQPLLANETEIKAGNKKMRCDSVVYKHDAADGLLKPVMIIEYKSPQTTLSQRVFDQILDYNSIMKVPYLTICNGESFMVCHITASGYEFLDKIPDYDLLNFNS